MDQPHDHQPMSMQNEQTALGFSEKLKRTVVVGCSIVGVSIVMVTCGLVHEITPLPLSTAIIIMIVCGGVGGVAAIPGPFIGGLVGGMLAAPLGLLAAYYYVPLRNNLYDAEVVLAFFVGAIPGMLVASVLQKLLNRQPPSYFDDQFPSREIG